MGLKLAKEINSNIEKWLLETPDRLKWTQEDQLQRTEAPMAELPTELEDMVGDLMEQEVVSVNVSDDQEEVARRVARYDILAIPVVDDQRRVLGIVTLRDTLESVFPRMREDSKS